MKVERTLSDESELPATLSDSMSEVESGERPAAPTHIEELLGGYRLERRVGAGSMGEVFAAHKRGSDERVALKILSTTTATHLVRFKREFRTLADVEHPNLIRLHELVVPERGPAFFSMEYVEGLPFVDWVREQRRPLQAPELERLLSALRQLVEGVATLHERGCVHRDLKPANVLVTEAGRVVVLDFGLALDVEESNPGITRDGLVLGTPSYMAPEQGAAGRVGPEADIYALGVMLFECLTGQLPHVGSAVQVMIAKQRELAPDPGALGEGLPEWLCLLCSRLLAREPSARPELAEVLAKLAASRGPSPRPREHFVGRSRELAVLHGALAEVEELEAPVLVRLQGLSGIGKSALVRQFRGQLDEAGLTVLHGVCGRNELLPYKGVDAVVDSLSTVLRNISPELLRSLRPRELGPLVAMFPVLDELWSQSVGVARDYNYDELRRRGSEGLRELLVALGRDRPLLIHIDDFQWADLDSIALLRAILRPPRAPRALLLLAYRSEEVDAEAIVALAEDGALHGAREHLIELGGLSSEEARSLAQAMAQADAGDGLTDTAVLQARGSPLFIIQTMLGGKGDAVELDSLVAARLEQLEPVERELIELVATFAQPAPIDLIAGLCPEAGVQALASLGAAGLLVADDHLVSTAHDRVREVALAALDEPARRRLHWRIGACLRSRLDQGDEAWLFAAANHLDAGLEDVGALEPAERLALARLYERGGARALRSTAWQTARRYFLSGRVLLEPWMDEARAGRGEYELCVAMSFGLCQVEQLLEHEQAHAAFEELLQWSLTTTDYCRIAVWYCELLFVWASFGPTTRFASEALARLGVSIPAEPSWPRAARSFWRGWRAIKATELGELVERELVTDIETRAKLELAAIGASAAGFMSPRLLLEFMGQYCMLLTRHGPHDWMGAALTGLSMAAMAIGQPEQGRRLQREARRALETRVCSSSAYGIGQTMLVLVDSSLSPLDEVLEHSRGARARISNGGQRMMMEPISIVLAMIMLHHDAKLEELDQLIAPYRARGCVFLHIEAQFEELERWVGALRHGNPRRLADLPLSESLNENQRALFSFFRTKVQVLLGEYEAAERVLDSFAKDWPKTLDPLWWLRGEYELLRIVSLVRRYAEARPRERRRAARAARKHRRQLDTWSEPCPDNFGAMCMFADAELAWISGQGDAAAKAYERARVEAERQGVLWLQGLVSERMAGLALAQGHALLAEAAREAAAAAYESWGASAVVRRLRGPQLS